MIHIFGNGESPSLAARTGFNPFIIPWTRARTSIKMETVNPLYLAWCPANIDQDTVDQHLSTITKHSKTAHGKNIETARHIT